MKAGSLFIKNFIRPVIFPSGRAYIGCMLLNPEVTEMDRDIDDLIFGSAGAGESDR